MSAYHAALTALRQNPRTWLITGAAGFIGSNLLECLLSLGQAVVGLDNFSTGHPKNIDEALERGGGVGPKFRLIYGDVRDPNVCREACGGVDIVLHQAALASVPHSIEDPNASHAANVDGFMNMLVAAKDAKVRRFVYASSCAVYGDDPGLPKREERIGETLSPYAATKLVNEIYGKLFHRVYGLQTVGLRYFNVFGRRQDPQGPYAAVLPRWVACLLTNSPCVIMGDGETSRDFCHVDDVIQANLLAAVAGGDSAAGEVYNVASGRETTLNELHEILRSAVSEKLNLPAKPPRYEAFRQGDIRHSVADVSKINRNLGYVPFRNIGDGIEEALPWYVANNTPTKPQRALTVDMPGTPALTIARGNA